MDETSEAIRPPGRVRGALASRRQKWGTSRVAAGTDALFLVVLLAGMVLSIQDWRYLDLDEAIADVREDHPDAVLQINQATGHVAALTNLEASTATGAASGDDPGAAARLVQEFVRRPEIAKAVAVGTARVELRPTAGFTDPHRPAYDITRFDQFVKKVRVFGADVVASSRGGRNAAMSTLAVAGFELPDIDTTPIVDQATARRLASERYAALARDPRTRLGPSGEVSEPELVIFDPRPFGLSSEVALAWRTQIATMEMLFNARTGAPLIAYDVRRSARDRMTYDCANQSQCNLALGEKGPPSGSPSPVQDAEDVHRAAGVAHAYFQAAFGRDGFDDTGSGGTLPIESFVRVPDLLNAHWHGRLKRMEFAPGWATTDIVGHEYTHAVTEFVARLTLPGQPGAVAEFFSDFFGVMIEARATGKPDWLIGDRVSGFSARQPLRSMANPHLNGFDRSKAPDPRTNGGQPEHFDELVTSAHPICGSDPFKDNECVHFNSGILNKAAVLASEGGTFRNVTVRGISPRKLEQILFRTLTLLPSASDLKQTAALAMGACAVLATEKKYDIEGSDCSALEQALKAVGLR